MSDTRNGPQQHETEPEVRRVVDALEDTARQDRGTPDPGFEDRLVRVVASSIAPDPIPAPAREHRGWLRVPTAARVALAAGLVLAIGVGVVTLTPGPTPSPASPRSRIRPNHSRRISPRSMISADSPNRLIRRSPRWGSTPTPSIPSCAAERVFRVVADHDP